MTFPLEATPEMTKAALDLVWEESETYNDLVCRMWRAMAAVVPEQSTAERDILAERRRQIEVEGWTPQHDDLQTDGKMAHAAACYALNNAAVWPWSISWWKPSDRRRNLVKAGALILAEIERLDRLSAPASEGAE